MSLRSFHWVHLLFYNIYLPTILIFGNFDYGELWLLLKTFGELFWYIVTFVYIKLTNQLNYSLVTFGDLRWPFVTFGNLW